MNIESILGFHISSTVKIIFLVAIAALVIYALFVTSSLGRKLSISKKRKKKELHRRKKAEKEKTNNNNENTELVEEEQQETVLNAVVITKRSQIVTLQTGPATLYYMGLRSQNGERVEEMIDGSIYGRILIGDVVQIVYKGKQIEHINIVGHISKEKLENMR